MNSLASTPLRLGLRALNLRTRRWSTRRRNTRGIQDKTLRQLLARVRPSRFGRDHGIEPEMGYEAFCEEVPVRTYEDLSGYIDRMRAGEPDQLFPGVCRHFAVSSGTTAGPSKYLPINEPMLAHFRRAGLESLMLFTARTQSTAIFGGRHLFLGGATTMQRLATIGSNEIVAGDLSGIAAAKLPWWAQALLYEPGREIALLDDWPTKIEAIVARTFDRDIRLVAGIPSWLLILFEAIEREARRRGRPWKTLRSIWPEFQCVVHGGVPVEPYVNQIRRYTGYVPHLHEVFPASEGFLAAQDREAGTGLRLFDNVGIFYEFLPLDALDIEGRPLSGASAIPLSECTVGRDYAIVVTTPGGLCRYLLGDVVRIVSLDPPRILYAGRTRLQLSAFGEHVIERELTDALVAASREQNLEVFQFHVAPRFAQPTAGSSRGCHEWWIEFSGGTPDRTALASAIDSRLQACNDDYAGKRRGLGLEGPDVRLVPPGTFETWLKAREKWGGQNKMPRCRSDRAIADDLAMISSRGD